MVLNPNAKLLAIAGAYEVAIVVLPRASPMRLASNMVDCKYVAGLSLASLHSQFGHRAIQIGSEYHNTSYSAPIAKIAWHPWGNGGTTLMVMATDGYMR